MLLLYQFRITPVVQRQSLAMNVPIQAFASYFITVGLTDSLDNQCVLNGSMRVGERGGRGLGGRLC